jgi:hypothetical protein
MKLMNGPRAEHPRLVKLIRIWLARVRHRLLTVLLVLQVIVLFAMPAARSGGLNVPHMVVYGVMLAFVVFAIVLSHKRGALVTITVSVGLTIVGIAWRQEHPGVANYGLAAAGPILTQLSILWVVSATVFGPGPSSPHRILGAVVMYLGIGMIFTSLDILVAQTIAGSFSYNIQPTDEFSLRETMTYYSYGTLTTASFGDIMPLHPIARSLANLESICGQLFPATLLARIVSQNFATQQKRRVIGNQSPVAKRKLSAKEAA